MTAPGMTQLTTCLDQFAELASRVTDDNAHDPTPCSKWTVGDLVDHVTSSTTNFAGGVRGQKVDWATSPSPTDGDRVEAFRTGAKDLLAAWNAAGDTADGPGLDWQLAELSIHTWDLATALGMPTAGLDQQLAESGLSFMEPSLKDEARSPAFGPRQPAPEGADAYTRIAAFAGRHV